jgi:hypothetical protein
MVNITLTDEQVVALIHQLPKEKQEELVDQFKFEQWIDSSEGQSLLKDREKQLASGNTLSLQEIRRKLKNNS